MLEQMENITSKLKQHVENMGKAMQDLKDMMKVDRIQKEEIFSAIAELVNVWVDMKYDAREFIHN
jgi:acetolactate synthase small subunit